MIIKAFTVQLLSYFPSSWKVEMARDCTVITMKMAYYDIDLRLYRQSTGSLALTKRSEGKAIIRFSGLAEE